MFTWIWVFLLYSWKNRNFISKIRRSKNTDYAALNEFFFEKLIFFKTVEALVIIFTW